MGQNVMHTPDADDEDERVAQTMEDILTLTSELQNRAMPPAFGGLPPFGFPQARPAPFGAFGARDPHAPPQPGNLQE